MWEWLMLFPKRGCLPQISQIFGMVVLSFLKKAHIYIIKPPRPSIRPLVPDHILRRLKASRVLLMSMAMVSGPTPPGEGVSQAALWKTSGWTSPIQV